MYFQPIKNEDPRLDFYTMYKREATEHDTSDFGWRDVRTELSESLSRPQHHIEPVILGRIVVRHRVR